jgi:hypothetical protein
MIDLTNPETLWTLTNQCIAAVVVISGAVVAYDIAKHLQLQFQPKEQRVRFDDHSFFVPELGLTMADGGERTDKAETTEKAATDVTAPAPPAPPAEK